MSLLHTSVRATFLSFVAFSLLITGLFVAPVAVGAIITDELVVTARKREENLQEAPIAVSAFSGAAIEKRQIRDVADLARYTPGLSLAKAFGRSTDRPVIRGQGNILAGVQFGVESGVAYFIDGIYYPADLSSIDIDNMERIEVIRGPQAALYGRNTYAGAINFITKSPSDEFESRVKGSYGEDTDVEVNASVSGPIIDGVLNGGVYARYYSFDGEYPNIVTGKDVGDEQTQSISGILDWTPTDDFKLRTRLLFQADDDGTRAFFLQPSELNNCFPGTRSNAVFPASGSTNRNQYFCGEVNRPGDFVALNDGPAVAGQPQPIPGVADVPLTGFPFFGIPGGDPYNPNQGVAFSGVERDLTYFSAMADWDINGSGWNLKTMLGLRKEDRKTGSDSDHSSVNYISGDPPPFTAECFLCAGSIDEYQDYSVEVRLESPGDNRLRWLAGAFFYDAEIDGRDIDFDALGGTAVIDEEGTENWAVFGQVEFDITDALTAGLELRYFDEKKTLVELDNGFNDEADFDEWAPRVTIDWQATEDILLYGVYAKGYRPGGLNGDDGGSVGAPTYDQEESDTIEFGVKSAWLDSRLIANLSAFFIDATNVQLTTPVANPGGGAVNSIATNQGDAETFGVELDLSLSVSDNFTVGLNYALADSEFTEGCDEFQYILTSGGGLLTDAATCTGNNLNGNANGSIEGNQLPLSSEHQFSIFGDYSQQITDNLELFVNADFSWEDEKAVQVHNLAWVPSATILNAQLGVQTDRWSVAIYGRNLTDEDAPSVVTRWLQDPLFVFNTPRDFAAAGEPGCTSGTCSSNFPRAFFGDLRRGRNFGVSVKYNFGG